MHRTHLLHPLLGKLWLLSQQVIIDDLIAQLLEYFQEVLQHTHGTVGAHAGSFG